MTSTVRRSVLRTLMKLGFQVAPDALDYILGMTSPEETVALLLERTIDSQRPPVLSKEYVQTVIEHGLPEPEESKIEPEEEGVTSDVSEEEIIETELKRDVEILKNPDTSTVASEGTIDDFLALFNDRFSRIKKIYMKRHDTSDAVSIGTLRNSSTSARQRRMMAKDGKQTRRPPSQKVIGIIKTKNISRSRNIIVEIEDTESSIICVVPSGRKGLKGRELAAKGNALLLDEVICLEGRVDQDVRMIVDDVIYPDIPTARDAGRSKRSVYAAFLSDIHCGSHEFLEDEFDQFIDWLRGKDCAESDKAIIENLGYIFIAGDLVDGVGVYPEQQSNLAITSIYEQYSHLANKLRKIPKSTKILCIPGNHDACRQALPKPPIPREFAKPLYDLENVVMLGDPCHVRIEGVNVLMNHGDSLDDLVTNLPGASYADPAEPMKQLLKKRHLVPLYGGKTELAPLHRDWLVIETPPDVVHFGHAHHYAVDNYRGVQIINSGTFQGQTDFMRKQGIEPTPGMVTFLNLKTGAPTLKFFYEGLLTPS